jgi:hypothetical protein
MVSFLALISVALSGLSYVATAPTHRLTSSVSMFNHPGLKPMNSSVEHSAAINHPALDKTARDILARATPAPPHFLVYSDKFVSGLTGPPDVSQVQV